jgi:multidrug efflux pump subunit AcrA (membrane-fusion protein)
MDELKRLMAELGITEEAAQKILDHSQRLVEAETEKGKNFYREKDKETLTVKQQLKEKEDALKKLIDGGKASETTLETLKAEIEAVKAERDAEKQAREAEATKATREAVKNKLLSQLGGKVKMANHVIAGILAEHEIGTGESGYTIGGKSVDDFTSEFIKANEADLVTDQRGGTGDNPNPSNNKGWANKSLAELKADKII